MTRRPTTVKEATRPRRRPGDPVKLGATVEPWGDVDRDPFDERPACSTPADWHGEVAAWLAHQRERLERLPIEWQIRVRRGDLYERYARILQAKVKRLEREAAEAGRAGELRAAQRIVEAEMDGAETYAEVARGERCVGCGVKEGERHYADCRRWWARQHAEEMLKPSPFIQQVLAKKEQEARRMEVLEAQAAVLGRRLAQQFVANRIAKR